MRPRRGTPERRQARRGRSPSASAARHAASASTVRRGLHPGAGRNRDPARPQRAQSSASPAASDPDGPSARRAPARRRPARPARRRRASRASASSGGAGRPPAARPSRSTRAGAVVRRPRPRRAATRSTEVGATPDADQRERGGRLDADEQRRRARRCRRRAAGRAARRRTSSTANTSTRPSRTIQPHLGVVEAQNGPCAPPGADLGGAHLSRPRSTCRIQPGLARLSSSCDPRCTTLPLVEHDDLVAVADRAQPVRDDQAGAAAGAQALVDLALDERVERARRLVEDEQRGVAGERAGDLQPLALPAAPVRVRPPRPAGRSRRCGGRCRRGSSRRAPRRTIECVRRRRVPERERVADGGLEQDDVLVDERQRGGEDLGAGSRRAASPSSRISPSQGR